MREWSEIVGARLSALGLARGREEEIHAELAGHLEEIYLEARRRGLTPEDSAAHALQRVPDWTQLAQAIRRADQNEGLMSRDTKTLWLPGMSALAGAAAVLFSTTQLVPSSLWTDPRTSVRALIIAPVLSCYLALGALGASWSRYSGGSVTARYLAGIFPLALHLAIMITTMAFGVNFQLSVALAFLVIPGIALTIGALPFLRSGATRQTA